MDASGLITALSVVVALLALLPEHIKVDFLLKKSSLFFKIPATLSFASTIYFLFWKPLNENGLTFGPAFINGFDAELSMLVVFIITALSFYVSLFICDLKFSKNVKHKWLERVKALTTQGKYDVVADLLNKHKTQLKQSLSEKTTKDFPKISISKTRKTTYPGTVDKDPEFKKEVIKILTLPAIQIYLADKNPHLIKEIITAINDSSLIDKILKTAFKNKESFLYRGSVEGSEYEFPAERSIVESLIKSSAIKDSEEIKNSSRDYLINNPLVLNQTAKHYSSDYFYNPIKVSISFCELLYRNYLNGNIDHKPEDSAIIYKILELIINRSNFKEPDSNAYNLIHEGVRAYYKFIKEDTLPKHPDFKNDLKQQLSNLAILITKNPKISIDEKSRLVIEIVSIQKSSAEHIVKDNEARPIVRDIMNALKNSSLDTKDCLARHTLENAMKNQREPAIKK